MKSFSKILDPCSLASAEFAELPEDFCYEMGLSKGNWYYFSRLIVPPKHRRNGVAAKLMEDVVGWSDDENISIYLDINPYGDMCLESLIRFYTKYGFKQIGYSSMIRSANTK